MKRISLLDMAHDVVRDTLHPGDIAIDATVGNGNDTLFLLQQIQPTGRIYGFDVLLTALESARSKVRQKPLSDCLTLFHSGHEEMADKIPKQFHGQISVCMFNLGYLPGGDKRIVTTPETTIAALTVACRLLSDSGVITLVAYPGHRGGELETERIHNWCDQLNSKDFAVNTIFSDVHNLSAPLLFIIKKRESVQDTSNKRKWDSQRIFFII